MFIYIDIKLHYINIDLSILIFHVKDLYFLYI